MLTLWNDEARLKDTYLTRYPGYYLTGDGGYIDEDEYIFIMGRIDDVIIVAGHNLSTGSMEEALSSHESVAECAVFGVKDPLKTQVPLALVVLKVNVRRRSIRPRRRAGRARPKQGRAGRQSEADRDRLHACPRRVRARCSAVPCGRWRMGSRSRFPRRSTNRPCSATLERRCARWATPASPGLESVVSNRCPPREPPFFPRLANIAQLRRRLACGPP